jgi:MSHA biogenesis protein MshG
MTLEQRTAFFEQMATMARGGLSLRQSLDVMLSRRPGPGVRELAQSFSRGIPIAEAFEEAGFEEMEIRLIEDGEHSGRLEEVYRQLAVYHRQMLQARGEIKRQLLYPVLLLHLAAVLGPLSLIVSNPFSYFLAVFWDLFQLYLAVGGVWFLWKNTWSTPGGQAWWLRLPLIGTAARATARYRWILALHLQFAAGIPLPEAARRAWGTTFFADRDQNGEAAEFRLRAGDSLSEVVADTPKLPDEWIDYLKVGEVSGRTEETLKGLASVAELEWTEAMKTMTRWVPKIFYGGIVLVVAWQLVGGYLQAYGDVMKALDSVGQ